MLNISAEFYTYALYILLIAAAGTCVFVIHILKAKTPATDSIRLFQIYFITGLLGWLLSAIKDITGAQLNLSVSATSYVITSFVLFLAILDSARNKKLNLFIGLIHFIFIIAAWLVTGDAAKVLTVSVYILLAYSVIFIIETKKAIQTENMGNSIIALALFLVAIAAPIQIQALLLENDVNKAYSIIMITSTVGFVMVGIGFLSSILINDNALLALQTINDPLTGMLNRRGLESESRAVIGACKRNKKNLSVIVIDIDHFRNINDRFGHDAGDQALIEIAGIISSCPRECDICCRLGGEEFAVILPDTDLENSLKAAERIRELIEKAEISSNSNDMKLTASFGVACENTDINLDTILKAADRALYRAKTEGRNCVRQTF